jgi:alanine racemase
VHEVEAGEGVSYGQTYRTTAAERLGLVPIGYADGYRRQLSNFAWMGVGGRRAPVRGRVCMDQTVIGDLGHRVHVAEVVGIIGNLANGPSIETMADWLQTISYEVVTSIGPRVPRYYWAGGRIVAGLVDGNLTEY